MPNSRRRKFSVQNDLPRRNTSKGGASGSPGHASSNTSIKTNRNITKPYPINSRAIDSMSIVLECDEQSSNSLVKKTEDKQDTNPTDLHTVSTANDIPASLVATPQITQVTIHPKRDTERDRKDNKLRPHRVRVRSPKRQYVLEPKNEIKKEEDIANNVGVGIEIPSTETVGTNAIDWTQENVAFTVPHESAAFTVPHESVAFTVPHESVAFTVPHESAGFTVSRELDLETEYEPSEHSLDDMCRICHSGDCSSYELGRLVSACGCRGTVGRVHVRCLERWLTESGKSRCELCGTRYTTRRVHRYGVPKALVMWFLSQNAQQLMVDGLGIMLMSPLAVLAAWLSGRTLAGLMTQETQVTPWPLASTFVLACMTLVCYYCWIVSAATRHALGWWIWYRSQYEVRLQLQDEE